MTIHEVNRNGGNLSCFVYAVESVRERTEIMLAPENMFCQNGTRFRAGPEFRGLNTNSLVTSEQLMVVNQTSESYRMTNGPHGQRFL